MVEEEEMHLARVTADLLLEQMVPPSIWLARVK